MKKEKIKPLPVVKAYTLYWLRRARRMLKLKQSEYDNFHIDYTHEADAVEVWFFTETAVVGWVTFQHDGRKTSVGDNRGKKCKSTVS